MGVIAVPTVLPQPGVPDLAVIERARKSMAGCGSCLGLGDTYDPFTGTWVGDSSEPGGSGSGYGDSWLKDVTRITGSVLSSVFTPPVYRQTSPTGTTEIRVGGGGVNYPGGRGPTGLPTTGVSTNTVLLLGLGVVALFAFQSMRGR